MDVWDRSGRVRLVVGDDSWDGRRGDLLIVPRAPAHPKHNRPASCC